MYFIYFSIICYKEERDEDEKRRRAVSGFIFERHFFVSLEKKTKENVSTKDILWILKCLGEDYWNFYKAISID